MKNRKIKIVHIIGGFAGGLCTYICTVLPELVDVGFEVTLICSLKFSFPDSSQRISELRKRGVKIYVIPMSRSINPITDLYCFAAILIVLLKSGFDIVHTHCSKAGVLGRCAAALSGIKTRLHSSHCFAFMRSGNRLTKRIYIIIERLLGKITTEFVAVSQSDYDSAKRAKIFSEDKCVVINNALPTTVGYNSDLPLSKNIIKASLGLTSEKAIVTSACRLVEYKGIFRFLEAARLCSHEEAVFLIAGVGKLKSSIAKFIRKNQLGRKIKLLGYVSDMKEIYLISDVVALCSDSEAQPYFLLEAMQFRCPIVATNVPGNKELLGQSRGVLVEPTAQCLSDGIDQLLADEAKCLRYAENAYSYFKLNHNLEMQICKLTKLYKSHFLEGLTRNVQPKIGTE